MTPADIERVFGRDRLRMVTGAHVEVFREASLPGERRRYTKRFLDTAAGDFRHWTEREWRILSRLFGHGIGAVPEVVQFDRGAADRPALVQTYDAGITVDHWATLLPVQRDGRHARHVFEDCAHWWALARACLVALDAIHELQLVHLDLKADNVCIPFDPVDFDPKTHANARMLSPRFEQIALIDFAFSLVSGENLTRALPIARQTEYDYQSPRLLEALEAGSRGDLLPTRQLDWRCDVYSLVAMLRRYLPDPESGQAGGWTRARQASARAFVRKLLEAHDGPPPALRPHAELIALASAALLEDELTASLAAGWTLAIDSPATGADSPTPVTRIALPVSVERVEDRIDHPALARLAQAQQGRIRSRRWAVAAAAVSVAAVASPWLIAAWSTPDELRAAEIAAFWPPPAGPAGLPPTGAGPAVAAAAPSASASATLVEEPTAVRVVVPATIVQDAQAVAPATTATPSVMTMAPTAERIREPTVERVRSAAAESTKSPARLPPRSSRTLAPPPTTAKTKAPPAALAAQRSVPAPAAQRVLANAAPPISERARALAWLTARGPAPRGATGAYQGAWPAVALMPASSLVAPRLASPVATVPAAAGRLLAVASVVPAASIGVPAAMTAPAALAANLAARTPTPAPIQTIAVPPPTRAPEPERSPRPQDYASRATELLASDLPRFALRAERRISRVLQVAAGAGHAEQDDEVRRAASALRDASGELLASVTVAAEDAHLFHESAQHAFWRRGSAREAIDLQMKAFAANPFDAEVASSLAFLSLKLGPERAEVARQLAQYALTLPQAGRAASRIEQWTTLAIASALAGREADARNAWFVSLALSPQPERQCRAAINAYTAHGEPLRGPVEAMLYRANASGRAQGSSLCEWPPHWMATRAGR